MTPPPSTPKKSRRIPPKIIGHTASTPRASGTTARSSLRALALPGTGPARVTTARASAGAPGMRGFPRSRSNASAGPPAGVAVSVTLALREQAESAREAALQAAPEPELLGDTRPRRTRKPGPARPSVRGRPTVPDAADQRPLTHAPAAGRPDEPPLRTTLARPHGEKATTPHRTGWRRAEAGARTGIEPCARPRPSRVLAELHAALADDAAAAE